MDGEDMCAEAASRSAARRRGGVGAFALLVAACGAPSAWAVEPTAFIVQASGFDAALVADSSGRVIHPGPGTPQRLAAGHWLAVDFQSRSSVWFDDAGRVRSRGPYVEIRMPGFSRHHDDPDATPLFSAWSQAGTALLRADGSRFIDWQPGHGEWSATAHPQRYSWRSRDAGERIFDTQGRVQLQLEAHELRAAGPFAGRPQYLVCDLSSASPCALRDEAGSVLWTGWVDDLVPLDNGGWLARRGSAWRRLDADGQPVGDPDRILVAGQFLPRARSQAGATVPTWPRWMTEYRIERTQAEAVVVREDTARGGLLQADGRFVPVPGASAAEELCPGVWRFSMDKAGDRLGDAGGHLHGRFDDHVWRGIEERPDLRLAVAQDGRKMLVDCRGRRLFDDPAIIGLVARPAGFLGRLKGEAQSRLWLDAALRPHLLPEGSAIVEAGHDGALLTVRTADGLRLYHVQRGTFVGDAFVYAEALLAGGVVFMRDGYYGFMDADGNERLPPRYSMIRSWGGDRLWSSRYVDEDTLLRSLVSLHRMDGSVVAHWQDATVGESPMLRGMADEGPVTVLLGGTFETARGHYSGQQWVDRDGRTLLLGMECRGSAEEADGAVLEPASGPSLTHGAGCTIPEQVRAAMAGWAPAEAAAGQSPGAGGSGGGMRSQPSSLE